MERGFGDDGNKTSLAPDCPRRPLWPLLSAAGNALACMHEKGTLPSEGRQWVNKHIGIRVANTCELSQQTSNIKVKPGLFETQTANQG